MKLMDGYTGGVLVDGDPAGSFVELHIEGNVIRLNREEARRLAAHILLRASQHDEVPERGIASDAPPARKTA
jgi:hypothetical protein